MKESELQTLIINHLRFTGKLPFAVPNGFVLPKTKKCKRCGHIERFNKFGYIKNRKKEGMLPGAPDLVVLYPDGLVVFLELKVGYNKQQPTQKLFEINAKELGHHYYVIKSLKELEDIEKGLNNANTLQNTKKQQQTLDK
jgi:hypothetical protein